ncbi:MAG: hypothetical protein KBT36_08835 [Kurthia sp.]|nr:hypothetical protein [Candidatus Kurthia equi]
MDIQKELDFIKAVTVGLLNKKGISFDFGTRPRSDGHLVRILIVNDVTSGGGNYQRIQLSHLTSSTDVHINFTNHFIAESHSVAKEDAPAFLKALLASPKGRENKEISSEDDVVDFYKIFATLSEQVFSLKESFELNHWKKDLHLYKTLNKGYNSLDAYHVHGGVGSAANYDQLHCITTGIDFGTIPEDGKSYMQVYSDIAEGDTKYPLGLYENATADMFAQAITEQYQYAYNRTK